jgi:4-amino-4-deoxy-L-arabinose transferase-like glycosyltransferase
MCPWLLWWPLSLHDFSPLLFDEWLWDNNVGRFLGWNDLGPPSEAMSYWSILPWFAFPALPLAAWSLWLVRRDATFHPAIPLLVVVLLTTLGVLLISRNAREVYALPLLLPFALLAVPGIAQLPQRFCATWYRFNVVFFSVLIVTAWLIWVALEFGVPASLQQMLLRLSPAYEPGFKWSPFVAGLAYTFAWVAVMRSMKASTDSAVSLWTVGVCVLWALLMTLFIGSIDSRKSYRNVVAELRAVLPPAYECIVTRHVGESERSMLQYFGGLVMVREESGMERSGCRVLLVETRSIEERDAADRHNLLWEGGRRGQRAERFLLYHWPANTHGSPAGKEWHD